MTIIVVTVVIVFLCLAIFVAVLLVWLRRWKTRDNLGEEDSGEDLEMKVTKIKSEEITMVKTLGKDISIIITFIFSEFLIRNVE